MAPTLSPAKEQLRDLIGPAVDELTDRQCGRVLGVVFAAAKRELERAPHADQLELVTMRSARVR